jgi:hypothetical protein
MSPDSKNMEKTTDSTILTGSQGDSPKNAGKPTNQSKDFS